MKAVMILVSLMSLTLPAMADFRSVNEGITFADIRGRPLRGVRGSADEFRGTGTLLEVNDRRQRRIEELKEIFKEIRPGTPVNYKFTHGEEKNQTEESSTQ